MVWARVPALVCSGAILLAGCAAPLDGEPRSEIADVPTTVAPSPTGPSDGAAPTDLIGLWRVTDAAGEADQTWLRIDVDEFQLWRGGWLLLGDWSATDSLFVASVSGASGDPSGMSWEIEWLDGAVTLVRTGTGWELLTQAGDQAATLSVDGAPAPASPGQDAYTRPPALPPDTPTALEAPPPLPDGVTPATSAQLVGTWVPAEGMFETNPHIVLNPDGTWSGSDGCNSSTGRWATAIGGRLLATNGPSTAIGCAGAGVPYWFAAAGRAGVDGNVLVLLAHDGTELGRLARA